MFFQTSQTVAASSGARARLVFLRRVFSRWDLALVATVLAAVNLPLLHGGFFESLIFLPEPAQAGEWWRILAHPFVHVSWYHLLLDATAFLILYNGLEQEAVCGRLMYLVASGVGALLAALWAAPMIASSGLCGLSGVAHGLMVISGLEMITAKSSHQTLRRAGALCFAAVVLKSGLEAVTGRAFFTSFHFGLLGTPVAVCHAGGVLGGIVAFLSWKGRTKRTAARNALRSPSDVASDHSQGLNRSIRQPLKPLISLVPRLGVARFDGIQWNGIPDHLPSRFQGR